MDSKTVSKLIRSEIWPLLRAKGFTRFDSRTARRYRDAVIDVVNFQSFNSHLASGVGCTTFSFALNLGVYVLGSGRERMIKRGPKGRLLPEEYQCQFRAHLKKRSPVDGFAREDIFFINPEGSTTGACFDEARFLLAEVAPPWFDACGDFDRVVAWMDGTTEEPEEVLSGIGFGTSGVRSSYAWNELLAGVRVAMYRRAPTADNRAAAMRAIGGAVGSIFDFDNPLAGPGYAEHYALNILELIRPLALNNASSDTFRRLFSEFDWARSPANSRPISSGTVLGSEPLNEVIKRRIWPELKARGFSEFTERLAHRARSDSIEVVQIVPPEPAYVKRLQLPDGVFHVGLGILWPQLLEDVPIRRDRAAAPRPTVSQCHVMVWLTPQHICSPMAPTAFTSAGDVLESMRTLDWFSTFQDDERAFSFLRTNDWEIFCRFPLIGALGSRGSMRRLLYLAYLAQRLMLGSEADAFLRYAEIGIESYPRHLRPRYRKWFDRASADIRESANRL